MQDTALDLIHQFKSSPTGTGQDECINFYNLPAELRLRIDDHTLEDSEGGLVSLYRLSLVSRLIRSETFPYLLKCQTSRP